MYKKREFNRICNEIQSLKIQGARNVALAGVKAYKMFPNEKTKKEILSLRPTEPLLYNFLKIADKTTIKYLINRLTENQKIINRNVLKLIKNDFVIFTHCHSSTVVNALIYAKKKGKKFEVYLTETRPLYQGRKTAKELKTAGINVTMFVDSAGKIALTKSQETRDVDLVLFGTDAITKNGCINKVGSGMFAQIARLNKIPVYVLCDAWKYSAQKIGFEKRRLREVWSNVPKRVRINNFAFELIDKKDINGIVSELGILSYNRFLKEVKKNI